MCVFYGADDGQTTKQSRYSMMWPNLSANRMLCVVYSNKISSYRTKLASPYRIISTCKHYANLYIHIQQIKWPTYVINIMCIPAKAQTCVSTHQRNQRDIFKVMKKKSSSSHVTMPKFQEEGDHFPQWAQSFNPAFRQQSQQWTVNISRRDGVWYYLRKAK